VQDQLPRDTLFGRWVGQSGLAIPLLVLAFAQMWAFPVLAGILGGDVFAGEDRLGTWDLLLTRSRGKGEVFAGKVLTALGASAAAVSTLAAGSIGAGLVAGGEPLVGLDGSVLHGGRALGVVAASWLTALLPTLAFTALALMLSTVSRSGIVGVGGPVVVGLALQLLALVDTGPLVHRLLPTTPFDAWHALVASQPDSHPALRGSALSLAYLVACLAVAGVVFLRRDES